jgi:hypothetical protein
MFEHTYPPEMKEYRLYNQTEGVKAAKVELIVRRRSWSGRSTMVSFAVGMHATMPRCGSNYG